MRQWRLIYDQPTIGAKNMAVDDAILTAVGRAVSPPTLRLYAWQPACLSLGYGQRVRDVDFEGIARMGWDVVRRPSGGRAILHTDELTYSVSLPIDHPLAQGDVVSSYQRISRALVAALHHLGLSPQADRHDSEPDINGPVCFEVPSHYEITVGGRKLVGSAQLRRRDSILQHGTLPLTGDLARICDALAYDSPLRRTQARAQVRGRAATLEEALGRIVSWSQAAEAVAQGFADAFDLDFYEESLSRDEQAEVNDIMERVYLNPDWTHKR